MNKENFALKLVDEIILYYDARSKKNIKFKSHVFISVGTYFHSNTCQLISSSLRSGFFGCHWVQKHEATNKTPALFCNITQRMAVIPQRRFGTTYSVTSSRVFLFLVLQNGPHRLSRNVGKKLPLLVAYGPRRSETQA